MTGNSIRNFAIVGAGVAVIAPSVSVTDLVGETIATQIREEGAQAEACGQMPNRQHGELPPAFLKACNQAIARVYEPYNNFDQLSPEERQFSPATQQEISDSLESVAADDKKVAKDFHNTMIDIGFVGGTITWLMLLGGGALVARRWRKQAASSSS